RRSMRSPELRGPARSATERSSSTASTRPCASAPAKQTPTRCERPRSSMEIADMTIANLSSAGRTVLCALALGAALAFPAFAQDTAPATPELAEAMIEANTQTKYILNSFLMLFGGVLVFWMAAGFTMLEAGLV